MFSLAAILQIPNPYQTLGAKSLTLLLKHQLQSLNKPGYFFAETRQETSDSLDGLNENAILLQNNHCNIF